MARDVESLDVFRKAYALSLAVHRISLGLPKIEQYGGVADQWRRATKSVCALLAEGSARHDGGDREFRRYVLMALGSAEEAKLWTRYAQDLGYLEPEAATTLFEDQGEVCRMLQGLAKTMSSG